jgi:hypothetical protein
MLQEDQTVSFQPMNHEGRVPWFVSLFVIYLLCVLLMTFIRVVFLMWTLRKRRKAQEREVPLDSSSQGFWEDCQSTVRSIRNFSQLTFLLAALVLFWNATNILAGVSTAKAPSLSYVAADLADALVPFLSGIVLCTALFCSAMFLERLVRRRRLIIDRKAAKSQLAVE